MKRILIWLCVVGLGAAPAWGQDSPRLQELQPTVGLASNTVQELASAGDSLWAGPLLTVYAEEDERLFAPDDPVVQRRLEEGSNVVLSLAAGGERRGAPALWAGLAFDAGGNTTGAGGFLVSTNGGASFTERPAPLDDPSDTTVTYGTSTLPAVPITQEAGSPPRDLAIEPQADTVWAAGGRSGLRRWTAQNSTWTRSVLPPDTSTRIDPSTPTDFLVAPPLDDGRGSQNHRALSVLVDETGTVWAGTAAGLNRSRPDEVAPSGARAWRLFRPDGTPNSLPGQVVFELTEQPRPNARNPVWVATLRADGGSVLQRSGLAVTPDGGETFRQPLIGVQVNDVAARRTRVYAATEDGLFVSGTQGETWRTVEEVVLAEADQAFPGTITARAVEVTSTALWVGTTEGLLRLNRADEPRLLAEGREAPPPEWQLFRTEVPVNPDAPTEQVPDVETYAYPNPFAPSRDDAVRIVYDVPQPQTVKVSIYDFGMNRVRTLEEQEPAGQQEIVWDGTDASGLRLPTGTYLYTVEVGGTTVRGKILLAN
ncbi:FlgD immunoglobulin-like domain containing protein [Salinibacter altiplanensis]|uniref:FlgD immunoglobulin-like domain containing protein n=1 Tax=Salinibacter altiplanensis TaxID=1803181 RepID=UPI000C9FD468|nr:FlgD immunoglobulin-like domain containing protein [Salinibacter altiplanensis]